MTYDFSIARMRAHAHMPYLSRLVHSLVPVQTEQAIAPGSNQPSMAVDKHCRCYYHPDVLRQWTLDQSSAVILHEGLHIFFQHCWRLDKFLGHQPSPSEAFIWNIAADLVVNQSLMKVGQLLPDGCCFPDKFGVPENLTTEEYYALLRDKVPVVEVPVPGYGGSSSDGVKRPWEHGQPGGQSDGEAGDNPAPSSGPHGLDEYQQMILAKAVAQEIDNYAKTQGTVPALLKRAAELILRPAVDPFAMLRSAVRHAVHHSRGGGDYTFRRLPRRVIPGGARLPASVKPTPRATVVIDTSGSMSEHDLAYCLGVVEQGLSRLPKGALRVICCDAAVSSAQRVFKTADVELTGGGGTDMGVAIQAAAREKPAPDAIVVVSDCYTPWCGPVRPHVIVAATRREAMSGIPDYFQSIYVGKELDTAAE